VKLAQPGLRDRLALATRVIQDRLAPLDQLEPEIPDPLARLGPQVRVTLEIQAPLGQPAQLERVRLARLARLDLRVPLALATPGILDLPVPQGQLVPERQATLDPPAPQGQLDRVTRVIQARPVLLDPQELEILETQVQQDQLAQQVRATQVILARLVRQDPLGRVTLGPRVLQVLRA
jgi:hypothetical protein